MFLVSSRSYIFFSNLSVNTRRSSDADDTVSAGLDDTIVRNALPTLMGDALLGKVSWIIMVAADKNDEVVRFLQPSGNLVKDGLVVSWSLEPKATIPGDDEQGVRAAVLNAQLMDDALEVSVNVAADDDRLDIRVVK